MEEIIELLTDIRKELQDIRSILEPETIRIDSGDFHIDLEKLAEQLQSDLQK